MIPDARAQGNKLNMHYDVDQENSVTHIWQCLNDIGVDEIEHRVNSHKDDELIEEIRRLKPAEADEQLILSHAEACEIEPALATANPKPALAASTRT